MYTLGRLWTPIPFSAPMRISMISFLKSHSYLIFRCIAIQLGMTMFGLVLSMATVNNEALQLVVGIFSVLFYLYLLIDASFSVGLKEQPKVAAGRAKAEPYTGLLVSLCANALNIALAIAIYIGSLVVGGVVLAIPGFLFAIAAGVLFGPILGTICYVVGATIAAVIAFFAGRTFLKGFIKPIAMRNKYLKRWLYDEIQRDAIIVLLITRTFPVIPYNVQNFAYGTTDIDPWTYTWGTALFRMRSSARCKG